MQTLRYYQSVMQRRKALEKELGVDLNNAGRFSLDEGVASTRNCENMIGATQIPLGIAGPLLVKSQKSKVKSCYVPLATTEGALVASVNRGCKAITGSGGATVAVEQVGATRGPVFRTAGLKESMELKQWLQQHFNELNHQSQQTSHHLSLTGLDVQIVGRYVYIRFSFDTQDAMGMNMATIATQEVARFIEQNTHAQLISLAGNFDVDKKPSWLNFIQGRGKRVWAEAVITHDVLESVLKTTAQKIYDVWLAKCMQGSALSGSMGYNCHFANVVAAFFIATGQDPAHIGEGSLGITTTEIIQNSKFKIQNSNLYISIYLPDVMVGTVGGGTGLATQKEALSMMGLIDGDKGNNAIRLAQILGAAVLAGELSLLASLAQGSLAQAHEKLGRTGLS